MSRMRMFGSRLVGFFRKGHGDESLNVELRSHLDALTEGNIRRGMSPEEARYVARREFGGVEQTKELYREQSGLPFIDALLQDTRFAVRMLAKKPGFAFVAILTLAVGIGATSAGFYLVGPILVLNLAYSREDSFV